MAAPTTGEMLLTHVKRFLVPTLRRDDIVVADDLGPGNVGGVEQAGAALGFLPEYSPELDPIDMTYSQFKSFLRKAAQRTIPGLYRAIRSFVPQPGPRQCANYFRHAGYVSI